MIYKVLIISTSRIKARYNPHTSTIYLRLEHDGENRVAVAFVTDAVRGSSPSMEISEVFFKQDTLECEGYGVLKNLTNLQSIPVEGRSNESLPQQVTTDMQS